ncbi:ABC transporter substrate-binding protein [Micromonospora sp. MS34]|uniref:ABC transporter substrate-binding protein n=1 Tax=Micromonospora sp. MS34 TaxID=3385971 RepID=UPI0039A1E2CB
MSDSARLTRRGFLSLAGAASTAAALSGCGLLGNKSSGDGKTINFYHWRAEDKSVFDSLIAKFKEANPGYDVTMTILPSQDYQSTALQKFKNGGSVGDVFTAFRGAQFEQIAKANAFTDLSGQDYLKNYVPALIEAGAKDGRQLGLPYQLVYNMPLYNVDMFTKVGVTELPKDWQGFLDLCDKLRGLGVAPIAFPGGDAANAGQLLNCMVMNEMPSDDGFAKIESGEAKVTDDWFLRVLTRYQELVAAKAFQDGVTGTKTDQAIAMFAQGKAAMLPTGTFHMGPARKQGATFKMNLIGPITTTADKVKYEGIHNATFILGINAKSDNKDAAHRWVRFLSEKANAETYANGTVQHLTVQDLNYSNEDLEATAAWTTRKTLLAPRFQFNDLDMRNATENAATRVVGGADPREAAAQAQKIIDQKRASK